MDIIVKFKMLEGVAPTKEELDNWSNEGGITIFDWIKIMIDDKDFFSIIGNAPPELVSVKSDEAETAPSVKPEPTGKLRNWGYQYPCCLVPHNGTWKKLSPSPSYISPMGLTDRLCLFETETITGEFKPHSYTFNGAKGTSKFVFIDDLTGAEVKCSMDAKEDKEYGKILGSSKAQLTGSISRSYTTYDPYSMHVESVVQITEGGSDE